MALITLKNIAIGFGAAPLLDGIDLNIEHGERVCLLGRNGQGKSTLINILEGNVTPDNGDILKQQGTQVALLGQAVPADLTGNIFSVVAEALTPRIPNTPPPDPWQITAAVDPILSRLKLDPDTRVETLSAGMKRQVLFARAMVTDPDVLLLDEPTNHLDIDAICRLEDMVLRHCKTVLFVTHDREFIKKMATRIIELDRGKLTSWACGYPEYLQRKDALLKEEIQQNAQFDKKLAVEETWIRQGIKARRTRNEGRVRALIKLREERRARREQTGTVRMRIQEAQRTGKLVLEATGISFGYDDTPLINPLSFTVMRGDKVGLIGPNGCGKTTLLRIMLGALSPKNGNIRYGTHLQPVYFDQIREQLDEEKSLTENIGEGKDHLTINGKQRHVIGYLKDFLFSPDRSRSPVKTLSGGERNRLLLARLFAKPSNVLVLDEPTNDLDMETLDLLEELLSEYSGTVLLVSHDRAFINNVVTSTLVFEGKGNVKEYIGGYDDWLKQRPQPQPEQPRDIKTKKDKGKPVSKLPKLGFNEKRELEALPEKIERLEEEQNQLYTMMSDPDFYQNTSARIAEAKNRLQDIEKELEMGFKRWEYLETLAEGKI